MNKESALDFSLYSDESLESSLSAINRDKYEHNYAACLAEIEKRKQEGKWKVQHKKTAPIDIMKIRKWVRAFAMVQALGAVWGIGTYLMYYVPSLFAGKIPLINLVLIAVAITIFSATGWAGWKYWKTEHDEDNLWQILLAMQIPAFNFFGYGYEFFSGFKLPVGFGGGRFGISANLDSNIILLWNSQSKDFHFAINLAAILALVLLSKIESDAGSRNSKP